MGASPIGDVTKLNAEGGGRPDTTVLESYVPVGVGIGASRRGVLELYDDYGPIAERRAQHLHAAGDRGRRPPDRALPLLLPDPQASDPERMRKPDGEIEHKAYHDDLTDLPNSALFNDRAELAVHEARANGTRLAVMVIDLDRFKDINDTLGHDSGDRLLAALADRPARPHARRATRSPAWAATSSGSWRSTSATPTAVLALAQKVRDVLAQPRRSTASSSPSTPASASRSTPSTAATSRPSMRRADVAMYRSKETHAPALYDERARPPLSGPPEPGRRPAPGDLKPRADASSTSPNATRTSGELIGVEALVRWLHPERGLLMPDEFIPLAEHTGLIRQLTACVLDLALRQCQRVAADRHRRSTVAVNISARDLLDSRFPQEVEALLDGWGVDPRQLELEITERSALTDLPRAHGDPRPAQRPRRAAGGRRLRHRQLLARLLPAPSGRRDRRSTVRS